MLKEPTTLGDELRAVENSLHELSSHLRLLAESVRVLDKADRRKKNRVLSLAHSTDLCATLFPRVYNDYET